MRLRPVLAALAATTLASLAWAGAVAPTAGAAPAGSAAQPSGKHASRVCALVTTGAACQALRLDPADTPAGVTPAAATPSGLFPADLQSAYKLPSATAGAGRPSPSSTRSTTRRPRATSASTAASSACRPAPRPTAASARSTRTAGRTSRARTPAGPRRSRWTSTWSSATCPNCHILLVEATTNSFANLGAAVNRAAALGADAISNSYGGSDASDSTNGSFYNHPGIAITASARATAASASSTRRRRSFVTAVGGTSLRKRRHHAAAGPRSAWTGAGSGCSAFNDRRSRPGHVQHRLRRAARSPTSPRSPTRQTGVAVFDSTAVPGPVRLARVRRHQRVRRRSSPRVYGLAGNAATIDANDFPYSHPTSLFDVTTGSQRHLLAHAAVHRAGRVGRADRARHAERHRRVLA